MSSVRPPPMLNESSSSSVSSAALGIEISAPGSTVSATPAFASAAFSSATRDSMVSGSTG